VNPLQLVLAAGGGAALTLLAGRLRRGTLPALSEPSSPVQWNEEWNPETARLAYEHARELYRQVDTAADVLDRKVIAVFTVASAIATLGPVLGRPPLWSVGWWFGAGAAVMWLLAATQCWQAFRPRRYRFDPNPATIAAPEWLALSPGAFHSKRLESVRQSVKENTATVKARSNALGRALVCAFAEVGLLLVALLWR